MKGGEGGEGEGRCGGGDEWKRGGDASMEMGDKVVDASRLFRNLCMTGPLHVFFLLGGDGEGEGG